MIQEEKQLLLKDLCARLPHGVKIWIKWDKNPSPLTTSILGNYWHTVGDDIKPYLRPMSSMTDDETDRMWEIYESGPAAESSVAVAEYLYERHLDCHHLIEKGLALEAPEGMYENE